MGNTIKDIEVIAYKGMNFDMTCRDFQYEIGKTYKTDKAELCEWGFHACLNPRDVLDYYFHSRASRYFKVKLSGEITKCGKYNTKVAATEITILEEITDTFNEVIETTEWWKNENVIDLLYFSDGFANVQRGDGLYNYIDKKGNILFNEWLYLVGDFQDGLARVQRGNRDWNYINKQGKLLSEKWFDWTGIFHDDFALVGRENHEYNYIDKQGNILSKDWFKWLDYFHNGIARVQREDDLMNFINKDGKIISNEWFRYVDYFDEYDLAVVERTNGECGKIDKTGKLIK